MPLHYVRSSRSEDFPVWKDDNTWLCRRHAPSAKMPASVDRCLYGCRNVKRPTRPEAQPVKKLTLVPDGPWAKFDRMGEAELFEQPIGELRKYATHGVGVERASKLRGGKAVLVPLILAKRAA